MESRAGILPATAYCVPKLCTKDKPRESREPPTGLFAFGHLSQGSSFLATLGFESESLWDSRTRFPKGIMPCPAMTAPHHADLISRPALRRWGRLEARPTLFGTPYELRE